jgi:TPR repeat protein
MLGSAAGVFQTGSLQQITQWSFWGHAGVSGRLEECAATGITCTFNTTPSMRRQDIQLRAMARQGDNSAKLLLAKMYLLGCEGTARSIALGLEYAHSVTPERAQEAAELVARCLPLEELLSHDQLLSLRRAAATDPLAKIKLALWRLLHGENTEALALFEQARPQAESILAAWQGVHLSYQLPKVFRVAANIIPMNTFEVALLASRQALQRQDLSAAIVAISLAASLGDKLDPRLHVPIANVVRMAEAQAASLASLEIEHVHTSLERLATQNDIPACYLLGRALCATACGALPWQRLVTATNVRKGWAYLLRAADAGVADAWLHLFWISSDYRSSASNAQMARFCLEKAAASGVVEAQRRLGALQMRDAETVADAERAIQLLFTASQSGDAHALSLLRSLVLTLPGRDQDAQVAIEEVAHVDPWLAARLRLSRQFGLTKLEALSIDPANANRPWGIVVGPNPFVTKARLSAPRAIPGLTAQALSSAREASILFGARPQESAHLEGTFRQRSANQRRLFERLDLDESLFFSAASSSEREALRIGSRWAHRCRSALRLALNERAA